ncbi:MAG: CAP domain-containing protein [Piptocephalis tieghemiana]|nr:MAG: CAP domain-containing protein [Piptocephalis tieghemiana]
MKVTVLAASLGLLAATTVSAFDIYDALCLVNKARGAFGLKYLRYDAKLSNAAFGHSQDQARMNKMTHDGSDGSSPGDRMKAAGFSWTACAENVAYGYPSDAACMVAWMKSQGHKENILNTKYDSFGYGVATSSSGTPYLTQDFATDGQGPSSIACPGGSLSATIGRYTQNSGSSSPAPSPSPSPSPSPAPAPSGDENDNEDNGDHYTTSPAPAPSGDENDNEDNGDNYTTSPAPAPSGNDNSNDGQTQVYRYTTPDGRTIIKKVTRKYKVHTYTRPVPAPAAPAPASEDC